MNSSSERPNRSLRCSYDEVVIYQWKAAGEGPKSDYQREGIVFFGLGQDLRREACSFGSGIKKLRRVELVVIELDSVGRVGFRSWGAKRKRRADDDYREYVIDTTKVQSSGRRSR